MDSMTAKDWIVTIVLAVLVGQALTRPHFGRRAGLEGIDNPRRPRLMTASAGRRSSD